MALIVVPLRKTPGQAGSEPQTRAKSERDWLGRRVSSRNSRKRAWPRVWSKNGKAPGSRSRGPFSVVGETGFPPRAPSLKSRVSRACLHRGKAPAPAVKIERLRARKPAAAARSDSVDIWFGQAAQALADCAQEAD